MCFEISGATTRQAPNSPSPDQVGNTLSKLFGIAAAPVGELFIGGGSTDPFRRRGAAEIPQPLVDRLDKVTVTRRGDRRLGLLPYFDEDLMRRWELLRTPYHMNGESVAIDAASL